MKKHHLADIWLKALEEEDYDRALGIMCSTHLVACSCWMCGHTRKHWGVTFQELKANDSAREQLEYSENLTDDLIKELDDWFAWEGS
jgi:hypothetical protein